MQVRSQTLKFIEPARVNLINAKALTTEDPSLEEFWDVIIKGKIYDETLKEDVYGISRDEWLSIAKYPPVVGVWDYFNLRNLYVSPASLSEIDDEQCREDILEDQLYNANMDPDMEDDKGSPRELLKVELSYLMDQVDSLYSEDKGDLFIRNNKWFFFLTRNFLPLSPYLSQRIQRLSVYYTTEIDHVRDLLLKLYDPFEFILRPEKLYVKNLEKEREQYEVYNNSRRRAELKFLNASDEELELNKTFEMIVGVYSTFINDPEVLYTVLYFLDVQIQLDEDLFSFTYFALRDKILLFTEQKKERISAARMRPT